MSIPTEGPTEDPTADPTEDRAPAVGGDTLRAARRGTRIHGALDVAFAGIYAWLGFAVAPGRSPVWNAALLGVVALVGFAGVALLSRARFGRVIAMVAQLALLGFCLATVALLCASAAYLRGIYGPIGKGLAMTALIAVALVVELCGLLPFFQLRFLLREEVRALFAADTYAKRERDGGRSPRPR